MAQELEQVFILLFILLLWVNEDYLAYLKYFEVFLIVFIRLFIFVIILGEI